MKGKPQRANDSYQRMAAACADVKRGVSTRYIRSRTGLALLGPQSRFGDKLLITRVFCPHIWECGSKKVKCQRCGVAGVGTPTSAPHSGSSFAQCACCGMRRPDICLHSGAVCHRHKCSPGIPVCIHVGRPERGNQLISTMLNYRHQYMNTFPHRKSKHIIRCITPPPRISSGQGLSEYHEQHDANVNSLSGSHLNGTPI